MVNRSALSEYLSNQLRTRGWSQSDLARAAKVTRAIISKLINQTTDPQPVTLIAIAKGLKVPVNTVFEIVGWIPPDEDLTTEEAELIHVFEKLPVDDQLEIIGIARLKLERQKGKQEHAEDPKQRIDLNNQATQPGKP